MSRVLWDDRAWDDYIYWQGQHKKTLKRINTLIKDIKRDPFHGIGKPEPLVGDLSGWWSRRIDDSHRIVYKFEDDVVTIAACRDHYEA